MEIDEGLAQRVRQTLFELAEFADISERKMFGGLVIMVNGRMTCGLSGRRDERRSDAGLMLRVGANRYEEALRDPYCRKMEFTGKPMTGFVSIDAEGLAEDKDLRRWLALALSFVLAQPPK